MAELRPGSGEDLPEILSLNNAAVPAVNQLAPDSLGALVKDAAGLTVARAGSELAGFLLLLAGPGLDYDSLNYQWFAARYENFLYVDRVVVAPAAQRTGLGRRFYDHAVGLGQGSYSVLCAEVNTRPRNEGSLAFHEALGFDAVGSQDTDGGSKTVRMFARALASAHG